MVFDYASNGITKFYIDKLIYIIYNYYKKSIGGIYEK